MSFTLKDLTELEWKYQCSKTQMRPDYVVRTTFKDNTANALTKSVVTFLRLKGHRADRISSAGRYVDGSKIVTDCIGRQRVLGSGKWIPGQTSRGYADINSTVFGKSVMIEIKMKDKVSKYQKEFAEAERAAGGQYWVVHNFKEFITEYDKFLLSLDR